MLYPILQEVAQYRDMTNVFGGYNHQLSCQEGQFYDMKNMTSQYFPILSPRNNRGIVKNFVNPQGILDKEDERLCCLYCGLRPHDVPEHSFSVIIHSLCQNHVEDPDQLTCHRYH